MIDTTSLPFGEWWSSCSSRTCNEMASMQLSVGFCYTSVVMLMISTSPGDCQEVGPRNISRMEGEKDVFISCPFSGQYLPAWEINGRVYELFQLPDVFIPASRGLLVPVVDVSLNGTIFRCIYPTGNGFHTMESSIGVLTVTPSRYSWVTQTPPVSPQFIYIDHQHTLFEEDSKMIAIKRPTQDPSCNNYIQSKTGCEDESEIINAWPIDSTSTTINTTDLVKRNSQDLAYFNISSEDSLHNLCERMQTNFQIKQQVVTKNLNASRTRSKTVTIPTETEETVNIILPLPNSQSFDCACPITFFNGQCTNLKTCSCIDETVFNTSVSICNSTDGLQLKFENLTEAMNGSRIFFYQSRNCDGNPSYNKYIASYEILEVLPEEPAVDVLLNVSEVCVHLRDDGISTDNYEINIYDITGEQTFHGEYIVSNISSPSCSFVGNAFSHESCQPFLVSVKAKNAYGSSYRNHSITSTKEGEVCSCLEKNVKAAAFIKRDNDQITATIFCSDFKYKSTVLFNVILEEENDTMAVGCESVNSTQLVIFDRVDCRMNYNISLVWVAPSEIGSMGTECIIDEKNGIQVPCSMGNQSIKKDIIIGSTVGGVILVIVVISIVICCICCCKWFHHKKRESYEDISGTKSLNHQ